jgi:hypothetical protein
MLPRLPKKLDSLLKKNYSADFTTSPRADYILESAVVSGADLAMNSSIPPEKISDWGFKLGQISASAPEEVRKDMAEMFSAFVEMNARMRE